MHQSRPPANAQRPHPTKPRAGAKRPSPTHLAIVNLTDPTILPEQFSPAARAPLQTHWLAALMSAVLDEAITCLQAPHAAGNVGQRELAQQAEGWIFADDPVWPLSFLNICAVLELDPGYLRRGLEQWRRGAGPARYARRRRRTGRRLTLKTAA